MLKHVRLELILLPTLPIGINLKVITLFLMVKLLRAGLQPVVAWLCLFTENKKVIKCFLLQLIK